MRLRGVRPAALALVVVLTGFWVAFLNTPFSRVPGFADWIGNRNGVIARNYLRYGLAGTRGGQVMNLERVDDPADRVIYRGHPAGLDLLTAAVFALTGSTAPWAHRLLPLLATLAGFVLLHRLLVRSGRDPWAALALYAAFPILGVHGVNLSYEPLCMPLMLGMLLLFEKGWRFRLVPYVFLGGLIDYPVWYLVPVLALTALVRRRATGDPGLGRTIGFGVALGAAAVASVVTHVLHLLFVMGDLTGSWDRTWQGKILAVIFDPALMPSVRDFFDYQWGALLGSFTLPGALLALAGAIGTGRRLGLAGWAFLFCGVLHVVVFRAHATRHDFWLWYLLPFFAIAGGQGLRLLPPIVAWAGFAAVVGLGALRSLDVWAERARPPVREVAADLASLFPARTVLHQMRGPAGWAVEVFRGHPVLEAADFLTQAWSTHTFQIYLDTVGGTWGYLDRPQRAYLFLPGAKPRDEAVVDRFLPGARLGERSGAAGRYVVYDIERFLFDPASSPELRRLLGAAECDRLWYRARMHLVLPRLPAGTRLLWVDGHRSGVQRFRGRSVRSAGHDDVATWKSGRGWTIAAWPGTAWATELERRGGDRVRRIALDWDGRTWAVPYIAP